MCVFSFFEFKNDRRDDNLSLNWTESNFDLFLLARTQSCFNMLIQIK